MGKKKKPENLPAVVSYFAFGQDWVEKSEFAGFVPSDGSHWKSQKELFWNRSSDEEPLLMDITNGQETISVCIHGFRIPEAPPVIALGSDATRGRVVLCQRLMNGERIAIHY